MSRPKVGAIGGLIIVSFILTTIATFTKNWIVWSIAGIRSVGIGIVPYRSNEVAWFAASSWMMFISFGLFFPLILIYLHGAYKVHHHGCCHSIRHNFHGVSLILSLIVIMESIAFILMAINASNYAYGINEGIGSSAYLALASAIVATVAMALSGHVARHDCH